MNLPDKKATSEAASQPGEMGAGVQGEVIAWYRDEQIDTREDSQGLPPNYVPYRRVVTRAQRPDGDGWKPLVEPSAASAQQDEREACPKNPYSGNAEASYWQRGFDGRPLGGYTGDMPIRIWHEGKDAREAWERRAAQQPSYQQLFDAVTAAVIAPEGCSVAISVQKFCDVMGLSYRKALDAKVDAQQDGREAPAAVIAYYTDWAGERRYAATPQAINEPGLELNDPDSIREAWRPLIEPSVAQQVQADAGAVYQYRNRNETQQWTDTTASNFEALEKWGEIERRIVYMRPAAESDKRDAAQQDERKAFEEWFANETLSARMNGASVSYWPAEDAFLAGIAYQRAAQQVQLRS